MDLPLARERNLVHLDRRNILSRNNSMKNRSQRRQQRSGLSGLTIEMDVSLSPSSERLNGPRGAILTPSDGSALSAASCSTAWTRLSRIMSGVRNSAVVRRRAARNVRPAIGWVCGDPRGLGVRAPSGAAFPFASSSCSSSSSTHAKEGEKAVHRYAPHRTPKASPERWGCGSPPGLGVRRLRVPLLASGLLGGRKVSLRRLGIWV